MEDLLTQTVARRLQETSDKLRAMSKDATPRIQAGHIAIGHTICEIVEEQMLPKTW